MRPFWKAHNQPEHFVEFNHYEHRIAALEATQLKVIRAILAYVDADLAATWMSTARDLANVLREALGEKPHVITATGTYTQLPPQMKTVIVQGPDSAQGCGGGGGEE